MNDLIPKIAGIIREGNPPQGEAVHENVLAREIARVMRAEIKEVRKQNPYLADADLCDYCFGFDLACQKIFTLLASKEEHGS